MPRFSFTYSKPPGVESIRTQAASTKPSHSGDCSTEFDHCEIQSLVASPISLDTTWATVPILLPVWLPLIRVPVVLPHPNKRVSECGFEYLAIAMTVGGD